MSTPNQPIILIIHAAFHVPESYEKLVQALRTEGFEVHIPRLESMNGDRPPNADLYTDTNLVRSYATKLVESGQTLAVVMHSYGGQVGTNALYGLSKNKRAAQGLPGGISHLLYMAAFAMPEGKAMTDKTREFNMMETMMTVFGFDEDGTCIGNFPKEGLIGQPAADELDPKELNSFIGTLGRWNGICLSQPLQNTPAWRDDLSVGFIYTLKDLTVPLDWQQSMSALIEKAGTFVKIQSIDAGHAPELTATKDLVGAIVALTSE